MLEVEQAAPASIPEVTSIGNFTPPMEARGSEDNSHKVHNHPQSLDWQQNPAPKPRLAAEIPRVPA